MIRAEDRKAVLQEIRLIVEEAIRDGDRVRAEGLAKIVAWTYPNSGMSSSQIADRIKEAAIAAGVPVHRRGAARLYDARQILERRLASPSRFHQFDMPIDNW